MVIGFPPGYLTKGLLERQKCLFATWLAGFVALPINLPGFGELYSQALTLIILALSRSLNLVIRCCIMWLSCYWCVAALLFACQGATLMP